MSGCVRITQRWLVPMPWDWLGGTIMMCGQSDAWGIWWALFRFPTGTGKPGKWEGAFQSRICQGILKRLEKLGKITQNTEKLWISNIFLVIFKWTMYYLLKWIRFSVLKKLNIEKLLAKWKTILKKSGNFARSEKWEPCNDAWGIWCMPVPCDIFEMGLSITLCVGIWCVGQYDAWRPFLTWSLFDAWPDMICGRFFLHLSLFYIMDQFGVWPNMMCGNLFVLKYWKMGTLVPITQPTLNICGVTLQILKHSFLANSKCPHTSQMCAKNLAIFECIIGGVTLIKPLR